MGPSERLQLLIAQAEAGGVGWAAEGTGLGAARPRRAPRELCPNRPACILLAEQFFLPKNSLWLSAYRRFYFSQNTHI